MSKHGRRADCPAVNCYRKSRAYAGWNPGYAVRWLLMVEVTGFEPVAPSLRTRCSAGLSYTPSGGEG
jgi:hypothetical protein